MERNWPRICASKKTNKKWTWLGHMSRRGNERITELGAEMNTNVTDGRVVTNEWKKNLEKEMEI